MYFLLPPYILLQPLESPHVKFYKFYIFTILSIPVPSLTWFVVYV